MAVTAVPNLEMCQFIVMVIISLVGGVYIG